MDLMNESSPIWQIIIWLFVGGGLAKFYRGWIALRSGRAEREKEANKEKLAHDRELHDFLVSRAERAEAEARAEEARADRWSNRYRTLLEHTLVVRSIFIQKTGCDKDLPPFPDSFEE